MVKRYESCIGLSLPSFGRWKIEFWSAPAGYAIKEHTHPNQDIKLIFLFGHGVTFHRVRNTSTSSKHQKQTMKWWNIGRAFTILAGDSHWFEVSNRRLLFMNIEKWKDGIKPTSASEDLIYAE